MEVNNVIESNKKRANGESKNFKSKRQVGHE